MVVTPSRLTAGFALALLALAASTLSAQATGPTPDVDPYVPATAAAMSKAGLVAAGRFAWTDDHTWSSAGA